MGSESSQLTRQDALFASLMSHGLSAFPVIENELRHLTQTLLFLLRSLAGKCLGDSKLSLLSAMRFRCLYEASVSQAVRDGRASRLKLVLMSYVTRSHISADAHRSSIYRPCEQILSAQPASKRRRRIEESCNSRILSWF